MYCLMADGHIYTLNHNVKRLEQQREASSEASRTKGAEEHCKEYEPQVSDCYQTREDAEPRQANVITTIDDVLQVIRGVPPQRREARREF